MRVWQRDEGEQHSVIYETQDEMLARVIAQDFVENHEVYGIQPYHICTRVEGGDVRTFTVNLRKLAVAVEELT